MPDPQPTDLFQEFRARCSNPGCSFQLIFQEALSAGYRVGDKMYQYPGEENKGRCGRCKTYSMVISKTPAPPTPKLPEGFWKVPTE